MDPLRLRRSEGSLLERGGLALDPLRNLDVRDEPLLVGDVVEALQHVCIGSEALHAKRNDDRRSSLGRRALHEGADASLGLRPLVGPVLAKGLDLNAPEGRARANARGARIELREPATVLAVVARAVGEDEDVFARRRLAE